MNQESLLNSPSEINGIWYEILHTNVFFENTKNYNTHAEYSVSNGWIDIKNTTFQEGEKIQISGKGKPIENQVDSWYVSFEHRNYGKRIQHQEHEVANYIISRVWRNNQNKLVAYLVTDRKEYLCLLHRKKISTDEMNYFLKELKKDLKGEYIITAQFKENQKMKDEGEEDNETIDNHSLTKDSYGVGLFNVKHSRGNHKKWGYRC